MDKVRIIIELNNGVLSYQSNVSVPESIGIMEGIKFNIIRNASAGGVGEPPGVPADGSPPTARGSNRAPGFVVRKVDS
jgi:hypothetical protein